MGVHDTVQARRLEGHDSLSIAVEAAVGALADAGVHPAEVDGVVGQFAAEIAYSLRLGPCTRRPTSLGIPAVLDAAALITSGECSVVLLAAGGAGMHLPGPATAAWTRPATEFVAPYGLFTAAEFALMARRHMIRYGTTVEQMAAVAATIRNNGHVNPAAVYHGRGPFTPEDIRASRPVAEPFHLLDCAMTSEGGSALVLAAAGRATGPARRPVWILGAGSDAYGAAYQVPPSWDLRGGRDDDTPAGYVGRRAAATAFRQAGLRPGDVDVCELYDPFSFEIIRQLEAFGFCGEGEGGPFVEDGNIAPGGRVPVTTDGGTLSYSHAGINTQMVQRVVRGVAQLRGTCGTNQVDGAEVALCSNGGSGALFCDVMLLGSERP